jgi:alpha-1,2-glucosyltransferase
MDEFMHLEESMNFFNGEFTLHPSLPQLPGYHILIAALARLLNFVAMPEIRFVTTLYSILSIVFFYLVADLLDEKSAGVRTLQYAFFPIIFPFFSLIYTDVVSVLFVLIALYCALKNKPSLSGLFWIGSMCIRQNNVVWLPLLFFIAMGKVSRVDCFAGWRWPGWQITCKQVYRLLLHSWSFMLGSILFVTFIICNKGIVLGDKVAHPFPSIHAGNIYFFLFIVLITLLPVHLENLPKMFRFLRERKAIWISMAIACMYVVFLNTFENSHFYNQGNTWLLRHKLLIYFASDIQHKTILFIFIALALLSLLVTRLKRNVFYLIYPLIGVYLAFSWLIEQRYYMIPIVFLLLFRERKTWSEYALAVYCLVGSLILFIGILNGKFFL